MKITFVLPYADMSGGVRVTSIYAERLKQRGHEVVVISTLKQPTCRQRLIHFLKGHGWRINPRSPSHLDTIDVPHLVIPTAHGQNITEADVPDADVIVSTWWETTEWVNSMSAAKGAKVYFVQHHEVFEYLPVERVKATYKLPFHKITISTWLVNIMRDLYGDASTSLVLNSVDTQQFNAPQRDKQALPTVGMLYTHTPWKGVQVALQAIALVKQKLPNLQVVAFGACSPSETLPLPPDTEYFCNPAQADIKTIYARCDVWLCASYSEGFGLPLVEAMACRTPIVSTKVGAAMDLIRPGGNGYLAPIGDAQQLAEGIEQILSLPNESWQAMSKAARQTVTQYTWDDAAEKFEAALAHAIDLKPPESPEQESTEKLPELSPTPL
jgi:glycosyltransferase involved in cell wall biosynthesis